MSQKLQDRAAYAAVSKAYENVVENWLLYDTVLITHNVANLSFNTGYFASYAAMGAANNIPFFNVRNRNSGLSYNNQDTRDQMPYAMKVYSIGVQFFAPTTGDYVDNEGTPDAPQHSEASIFQCDLPQHCSLEFQTNQDIRLKLNTLMAPSGIGAVGGGVAKGDLTNATTMPNAESPNIVKTNWNSGQSMLVNRWGFRNPIEIPRRANISVVINVSEYGRQLLQAMLGPLNGAFQDVANDGSHHFEAGVSGIRVMLGGKRLVQQRGQLHA